MFDLALSFGTTRCQPLQLPATDDGLFGYFRLTVPQHGCSASPESTTQYWFGNKL